METIRRHLKILALLICSCVLLTFTGSSTAHDDEAGDFFESRIRPLLAANCYDCHAGAAKGGLRVDSREALIKGGKRGPAIVPGKPEESLLIAAVNHAQADLRMPKGASKLRDQEIADLIRWVKEGAVWPASSIAKSNGDYLIKPEHKNFWSFQPVKKPIIPTVKNISLVNNTIDNLVLAKLERKGLSYNPAADKRALIRRATYDLTGLPPEPEEVEAFVADRSPLAFAKAVDRLLASPHYGERWGRHWLDLARYSDTLGAADFINGIQIWFPYSYTYRDWVIRVLNEDLPYDQFVIQQIAADRIPNNDPRNLAALGFLTLGRGGLGVNREERIDDRIDVVTRGTLGLTVSCARCHNHKFDPIPTRDYYSLHNVFANTRDPESLPPLDPKAAASDAKEIALKAEIKKIEGEIAKYREDRFPELKGSYRAAEEIAKNLFAVYEARGLKKETELQKLAQERDYNLYMLRRWQSFVEKNGENEIWAAWSRLIVIPEKEFGVKASSTLVALIADSGSMINPLVAQSFKEPPSTLREAADRYGKLIASFDKTAACSDPDEEALRQVLHGADSPVSVPFSDFNSIRLVKDSQFERDKKLKIENLILKHAYEGAPPRAMSLEDEPDPKPGYVFVRGNPANKGDQVERQFLQILAGDNRQPFTNGNGRLELASAIVKSDNPLTARVMVNRVWLRHFGAGLVSTPSDFGTRGEPPTHPDLLDHLASYFIENGWSLKRLHRLIMLSRAYQQSSADNPAARKADPENSLLWRMNRRRLDFESLRDSLLMVGGNLDRTMGGLPVSATAWPFAHRRTVYSFIDRVRVPNDFLNFDFAHPDSHNAQRYLTTVPQQALFMMNSPLVMEQAANLIKRAEVASEKNPRRRIRTLYRLVYGRAASAEEISLGLAYLRGGSPTVREGAHQATMPSLTVGLPPRSDAWNYGQGEYDEKEKRVKSFTEHKYFVEGNWRVSPMVGDPRVVTARLTDQGGSPGRSKEAAAIRRWVSPIDGRVSIAGMLEHNFENACAGCDGVQAWIASSSRGQLGHWTAHLNKSETKLESIEVKQGDKIDFIVDSRKNRDGDEFKWVLTIRRIDGAAGEWNSIADFRRPANQPLNAWERYAQVLLSAVEFVLID